MAGGPYRWAFLAILAVWLAIPFVHGTVAQDAVPFGVAGKLVLTDPGSIYITSDAPSAHAVPPAFKAESCTHYPDAQSCDESVVAFVSTPLALPLVVPLGWLGGGASLVVRLLGASAFVAAMLLAWRRLAPLDEKAPAFLVITAALVTPLVSFTVGIGQNAPLLFLGAMLPIVAVDRRRTRWWAAGLVVVTTALKVWPMLLIGVLGVQRRWRMIGSIAALAAALAAVTSVIAPNDVWGMFIDANRATTENTARLWNNGSLDAALYRLGVPLGAVAPVAWLVRAAALWPIVTAYRAAPDDGARWSLAWLAALLFFPQVWGHYLFVGVAAIVAAVAAHPEPRRWLWAVPTVAAAVGFAGWLSGFGAPVAQFAALVVALAVTMRVVTSASHHRSLADDEGQAGMGSPNQAARGSMG